MSNIESIKQKLATRPGFFLTVTNVATEVSQKVYANEINAHGGFENYLKSLYAKGVQEVYIEPRVKNGSSHKLHGVPFKLQLGTSSPSTELPVVTPAHIPAAQHVPGLQGIGLGQYMEAHASMRALQKLEQDHNELKLKFENLQSEKERLKDENVELKRTNDKLEDKIERKSPLDNIDINQALPVLLGLLRPQAQPAGLNAPAQSLSPIKEALRASIESEGMPDAIVEKLYKVLENYIGNNEKFINDFEALINQNNLKPVKNG